MYKQKHPNKITIIGSRVITDNVTNNKLLRLFNEICFYINSFVLNTLFYLEKPAFYLKDIFAFVSQPPAPEGSTQCKKHRTRHKRSHLDQQDELAPK